MENESLHAGYADFLFLQEKTAKIMRNLHVVSEKTAEKQQKYNLVTNINDNAIVF